MGAYGPHAAPAGPGGGCWRHPAAAAGCSGALRLVVSVVCAPGVAPGGGWGCGDTKPLILNFFQSDEDRRSFQLIGSARTIMEARTDDQ